VKRVYTLHNPISVRQSIKRHKTVRGGDIPAAMTRLGGGGDL
jgi:hypothetical protein